MVTDPRDYLETWLATWELYKANYMSAKLIDFGLRRLSDWWDSVLERKHYSEKTRNLFEIQIRRLAEILRDLPEDISNENESFQLSEEYYGRFLELLKSYDSTIDMT